MYRPSRDVDRTSNPLQQPKPATTQRPSARHLPSGAWGRLRAPPTDPLEVYGLPSKGETRLNDPKTQETYYKKIVERYMRFCAGSGGGEKLEEAFGSLNVHEPRILGGRQDGGPGAQVQAQAQAQDQAGNSQRNANAAVQDLDVIKPPPATTDAQKRELALVIAAMRKLREAVTSIHRTDVWAQRAYVFIIHSTILTRHWESYHPALLYLLRTIHPVTPLPEPELREVVGYFVLDLACRQNELAEAFRMRTKYGFRDRRVDKVLKALLHDNWVLFWRVRRSVDGYGRALMSWAEEGVRVHALKCLGRSYLQAEKVFVERCTERGWDDLVKTGVGWELGESGVVTIRKMRPK